MKDRTIKDIINYYNSIYIDRFEYRGSKWPEFYVIIKDKYTDGDIFIPFQPAGVNIPEHILNVMDNYLLPEIRQDKIESLLQ